jgi:LacI family transcriptional regulator
VQIDRVKQLLTQTDMTLEAIAHRCGFRHSEYMSVAFKRVTGTTPGKFRASGSE